MKTIREKQFIHFDAWMGGEDTKKTIIYVYLARINRDRYMSSHCRCFRTIKTTKLAKPLIAQVCATVSKGRQVWPFTSHRNNKYIQSKVIAVWRCCFRVTVDAMEFSAMEPFTSFSRVSRKQPKSERQWPMAADNWIGPMYTGINSKFYIAHCRIFETLHRLYLLSYTGARHRSGVRLFGAELIAGSSLRCASVLINNAGTVIALTVRWALRVHYYN